eukprot:1767673-Prymnesium_polylepis.1
MVRVHVSGETARMRGSLLGSLGRRGRVSRASVQSREHQEHTLSLSRRETGRPRYAKNDFSSDDIKSAVTSKVSRRGLRACEQDV